MTVTQLEQLTLSPEALNLHQRLIVFDASAVVIQSEAHFERITAGGVTVTNHTVTFPDLLLEPCLAQVNTFRRWVDDNSEHVTLCLTTADIHEAKASGRETIILGPQDTLFLGRSLSLLSTFRDLGLRVLQLTYQKRNWVGDGCGEPNPAGLSSFGRALVTEMNELGIVVDLSHCSRPTSLDAIEVSSRPVVLTHAHPYELTPHIRAKDDDLLRAVAATDGVIGLTALSSFSRTAFGVRPTLADFANHVDYLVELVGIDHVGIGLDMDETNTPEKHAADIARNPELEPVKEFEWHERRVQGLSRGSHFPHITATLLDRGYSEAEVSKVLGLNFLRVLDAVWVE